MKMKCFSLYFFTLIQDKQISYYPESISQAEYSKACLKRPLSKRPKIAFQDQLSLDAGQKYCRMLQGEHSAAILSTFIKLPFVFKMFVLSILGWLLKTGLNYCSPNFDQGLHYFPSLEAPTVFSRNQNIEINVLNK